jgi:hypothetical protein
MLTKLDAVFQHGICISYDRVLEISTQLGESVLSQFMEDVVVCPAILQKCSFTTSAVDNIDHNPSATTATTSCPLGHMRCKCHAETGRLSVAAFLSLHTREDLHK